MKMHWLPVLGLAATLALGACSKKEEPKPAASQTRAPAGQQEMPPSHPPRGDQMPGMGMGTGAGPRQIVVPDEVKAAWKAVVLSVADKTTDTVTDVTVDIGGSATQGDLDISVESFLPAFTMSGGAITSSSADTLNPAARLVVKQNGSEVFAGWLFSMYPDAHPFQHERYEIILKDFVHK
jgi:hypothetical protein